MMGSTGAGQGEFIYPRAIDVAPDGTIWVVDKTARVQHLGCGFYIYVGTRDPIRNYHDFDRLDPGLAQIFIRNCIKRSVYFHTDFTVSARHDESTLANALDRIREAALETREHAGERVGVIEKPPY